MIGIAQDAALSLTMRVLLSVKFAQMEEAVAALDREALDVLMKYEPLFSPFMSE